MNQQFATWIDSLPLQDIPDDVVAFCFNLYDGCDNENWSIELVGAGSFDADDADWAADEVTDFGSREPIFGWKKNAQWDEILSDTVAVLGQYLEKGKYAQVLKSKAAVAVGFVDGDLEILFEK